MTQLRIAAELTNDAILYALAGSLAFLAAVVVVDPKLRKSPVGKSLIMLSAGLAALYIPSVLHRFLGLQVSQAGFAWYFLATVVVVGTAEWWRTLLMVSAQLRGRRGRVAPPPAPEPLAVPGPPPPPGG